MADQTLYKEVTESIKAMFEMTTRMDERLQMLVDRQGLIEERLDNISNGQNELSTKVGILEHHVDRPPCTYLQETKVRLEKQESIIDALRDDIQSVEIRLAAVDRTAVSAEHKWKMVFDFIYQSTTILVICYLLWRLGLQTPPLP